MLSKFFIERPIFANVIAIVTIVFGFAALRKLPVEQYPQITPPTVKVTTVYPGGNAQDVADTVAAPIEQQVNGVENMLYMSSTSASDGSYALTITFDIGTNLDIAQVLVQNRVAIADPQLPDEVKRQGVTTKKVSTAIVLVIALTSPNGTYSDLQLSNIANERLRDELSRVNGVGDVTISGAATYGMRVWINPEKLRSRSMTVQDVINALAEQNVQVAAGQIGAPPAPPGQNFQYTITALGRLKTPEDFASVVVKTGDNSKVTYLRDVARVELGGQVYDQFARKNGLPAASVLIYQLPGANAVQVAEDVRKAMAKLSSTISEFKPGELEYSVPFDTTKFVEAAIHEVYWTLIIAGVLVLIVILVFLQDWRAVLVPATTVPVTIIGAFAFMPAIGFTVNMLTLFGLVLAIGIVVDDAIVIVENAAHHIEMGESPHDGTIRAMNEVTGPVLGITLVLMAVFLPTAALGGITGQLYGQFALTIAATAFISAVNALTLKPAQCASYLRPHTGKKNVFARGFNYVYSGFEAVYVWIVGGMVRVVPVMLVIFAALVGFTAYWYSILPTGFLPTEDQGYIITAVQLPDAASLGRTGKVIDKIEAILKQTDGVGDWFVLGGFSLIDGTANSNAATVFVVFKDWKDRKTAAESQEGILKHLTGEYRKIEEAVIFAFPPPAIQGLGTAGGFQLQLNHVAGVGLNTIQQSTLDLLDDARRQPALGPMNTTFRSGVPQLYADINRVKAKSLNVALGDVFGTLQGYLGSSYVNDFNRNNRTYQVRVQADAEFRDRPDDMRRLEVRNKAGQMVPLSTVADLRQSFGPQIITRYNLYPSAAITGGAAPGYSSGQALELVEGMLKDKLPDGMGYSWTGMSYQEKKQVEGGETLQIFGLAVLLVYLVLAAQYESWALPLAVILVVPLGLLGSVAAVGIRQMDNNVYTQIGIVLIIALASKNAILIVEFARDLRKEGKDIVASALQAARMRFRPILMTSFAFILGVYPLVFAEGAGAASRQALGTAVFGGMITSTLLAVFFTPIFFVTFQWVSELGGKKAETPTHPTAPAHETPVVSTPPATT
jgi:HAE1 family hydrophobic/amphiphilic exporter-1